MKKTEIATVVFLRDEQGRICLAPKKGNIHKGNKGEGEELEGSRTWNGYGGKQEDGETILETAIRELADESGVQGKEEDLELVARMSFFWPGNETTVSDMVVFFLFLDVFEGVPQEGEEMGKPAFFSLNQILDLNMMPADKLFLPKILAGEKLVWNIHLGKKTEDSSILIEDKEISPTL